MTSSRLRLVGVGIVVFVALLALANGARAGEYGCNACQGDSGWSGEQKLDEIGNPNAGEGTASEILPGLSTVQKSRVAKWNQPLYGFTDASNATKEDSATADNGAADKNVAAKSDTSKKTVQTENKPLVQETPVVRSAEAKNMLVPIDEVIDYDVLLDISENATQHIQGSIAIPYTSFLNNGTDVKSEPELVKILGDAGISREDPVVVYGECMPCGGGPAPATFVYWLLKSLGQENVRVLDGTVKDWAATGKPTANETTIKPPKSYASRVTPEYTASYDYVKSGSAQIVDARTMQEYGAGSIPGAINIPYESVISNNRIKDETKLERAFAILDKNQPVVVYTNTGIKASVVWFTLMLLGYDAKLYSYENWLYNQVAMGNTTI